MLINVTLWPGECIYNQRETTLKYLKKIIICYKIFVFVVINSLVILGVLQMKNVINLREYGKLFHPQRKK